MLLVVLLAAFWGFQWQVEAQNVPFEIKNVSASTDRDVYYRTDIIKINYSLFCQGNGEDPKMQLVLNKSFDFPQPHAAFMQPPQYYGYHCDNKPEFSDDKTMEVKLCDGPRLDDPTRTIISCNITPNRGCPTGKYDLTNAAFLNLRDSSGNVDSRIPKKITIKDNPPVISNFLGNTNKVDQDGILKFDFSLSDKDSENISYALVLNRSNSIIDRIDNTTRIQINSVKPISLNYNSSQMKQGDYVFRIFAQSNEGGYAWSTPWNVTISSPNRNRNSDVDTFDYSKFAFAFLVLLMIILFYVVSCQEEPIMGAIKSLIISVPIIIAQYLFMGFDFMLLLLLLIFSSIATNYNLSHLGKKPDSNLHFKQENSCPTPITITRFVSLFSQAFATIIKSIKTISKRNKPPENETGNTQDMNVTIERESEIAKKWALAMSSFWMALIMMIVIFQSSEAPIQNRLDFSIVGGVFLVLIVANGLYNFRKCGHMYKALVFFSCVLWLGSLIYIIQNIYVRYFTDFVSATYISIPVLLSLIFLPFLIFYYFAVVKHLLYVKKKVDKEAK
jgi:hypothetical protein